METFPESILSLSFGLLMITMTVLSQGNAYSMASWTEICNSCRIRVLLPSGLTSEPLVITSHQSISHRLNQMSSKAATQTKYNIRR